MCEFIRPQILRQQYLCFGHFYQLERSGEPSVCCRSTLEIVLKCCVEERGQELLDRQPDHLAFMMNPGSSYACANRQHTGRRLAASEVGADAGGNLVPAYPDKVQYQIMRIMACCGLKHVRVLNLSDQREPGSAVFLQSLKSNQPIPAHSILSCEREDERNERLTPLRPTVIVGWGQDDRISQLATAATQKLDQCSPVLCPVGRRNADKPVLFGYPSPPFQRSAQLLEWVRHCADALRC